jgi:hypothetical protein
VIEPGNRGGFRTPLDVPSSRVVESAAPSLTWTVPRSRRVVTAAVRRLASTNAIAAVEHFFFTGSISIEVPCVL